MNVADVVARAVFDSNGVPTIEAEVTLEGGATARAMAPRGSTTGDYEASVLEDATALPRLAAVAPAIEQVERVIRPALLGAPTDDQGQVDGVLRALDSTPRKEHLGGNTCVAVSMAACKAAAAARGIDVARYLSTVSALPQPMFNVIDGVAGPEACIPQIEFLLLPPPSLGVQAALEVGATVRAATRDVLGRRHVPCADSPQGSWAVDLPSCEEALDVIVEAAWSCGHEPGRDFTLGLDLAASDWFADDRYTYRWLPSGPVDAGTLLECYLGWFERFPLTYIEDAFAFEDEEPWKLLRQEAPAATMVVGDDLFASSATRLRAGVAAGLADAIVVKPNQVGTVSEALETMRVATEVGATAIVSQRSGDTDDAFITHLAAAGGAALLKAGGMSRMDRVAKYNELLRLAERA